MTPARNIEAKYAGVDLATVRAAAAALGARPAGLLVQRDSFFPAPRARLKLREQVGGSAELICYRRADRAEARASDYRVCPVPDPAALRALLVDALGEGPVVHKRRELWLWRSTRIHLDQVDGLGDFVELETVLDGETNDAAAHAELAHAANALGLDRPPASIQPLAYAELRGATEPAKTPGTGR